MVRGRDKRNAKRVSYVCEILCEGIGIGKLNTRINDISVTGLFIETLSHLPVGAVMNLRFAVLGYPIEVEGEVRYCMPQVGMGIQFRNLKLQYSYLIECLVERRPVDKAQRALLATVPVASESTSSTPSERQLRMPATSEPGSALPLSSNGQP